MRTIGNWNINIQGIGCHHNGNPEIDADLAAQKFVRALLQQGHTIEAASFTSGGKNDLLEAVASEIASEMPLWGDVDNDAPLGDSAADAGEAPTVNAETEVGGDDLAVPPSAEDD